VTKTADINENWSKDLSPSQLKSQAIAALNLSFLDKTTRPEGKKTPAREAVAESPVPPTISA
jgi:hypothetical protein